MLYTWSLAFLDYALKTPMNGLVGAVEPNLNGTGSVGRFDENKLNVADFLMYQTELKAPKNVIKRLELKYDDGEPQLESRKKAVGWLRKPEASQLKPTLSDQQTQISSLIVAAIGDTNSKASSATIGNYVTKTCH